MDHVFRIAGYLDEAGEDPATSCSTLIRHGINYTVLRNVWGGKNITQCNDEGCKKLRVILNNYNVSVISICSNIGEIPANQLMQIPDNVINRAFDIAKYFGAESIRFHYGTKTSEDSLPVIVEWLDKLSTLSLKNNIIPMLEITDDAHVREPANLSNLLSKFGKFKIQYDPVQIIIKRKINPFIKYWSLLKSKAYAIDVRDYVVGKGFKPAGFGDAKIKETLEDARLSNFKGWLFLEPNLGRKYGSATNKSETFGLSLEGIKHIFG